MYALRLLDSEDLTLGVSVMALRLEASDGAPLLGDDIILRDGVLDDTPDPGFEPGAEPGVDPGVEPGVDPGADPGDDLGERLPFDGEDETGAPLFGLLPTEGRPFELEVFDGIFDPDLEPGPPTETAVLDGFSENLLLKLRSDGVADPVVYPLRNDFDAVDPAGTSPTAEPALDRGLS